MKIYNRNFRNLALAIFSLLTGISFIWYGCGGGGGGPTPPPSTYSISGVVSGAVSQGVTITLTGAATATTNTDASGNYSFSGLANGSYVLTPTKTGYTFSPISHSASVNNTNVTGINFTGTTVSGMFPTSNVLYVASDRFIQVIDLTTNAVAGTIDAYWVSPAPIIGLAANATTKWIYAAWVGGPVGLFDAASGATLGSTNTRVAGAFEKIEVNTGGTTGYVNNVLGGIDILSFSSSSVSVSGTLSNGYLDTNSSATSIFPVNIALDPIRSRLYTDVYVGGQKTRLDAFDVDAKTVAWSFDFNPLPVCNPVCSPYFPNGSVLDIMVHTTMNLLYVLVAGPIQLPEDHIGIQVVDPQTRMIVKTIDLGNRWFGGRGQGLMALNHQTNMIYILDWNKGEIVVVNGATGTVSGTISLGQSAISIVVNSATNTGYVTTDTSVLVVDLATKTVIKSIALPKTPTAMRLGLALMQQEQGVSVSVIPATANLTVGGTQQFTATVTGSSNTSVTWSVQEGSGGGSIASGGLYTAPTAPGTYHVVATSQADNTKSATATVVVSAGGGSLTPGWWNGTYSSNLVPSGTIMCLVVNVPYTCSLMPSPPTIYTANLDIIINGNNVDLTFNYIQNLFTNTNCSGSLAGSGTLSGYTIDFSFTGQDCMGTHSNGHGTITKQ